MPPPPAAIKQPFSYQIREEPGVQSDVETLEQGTGSSLDFANLLMQATRSLNIAARFVNGYLKSPPQDGHSGSAHAWAEVYLPRGGL
jgi:transglutaminase-like putative cysteine protease